MSDRTRIYNVVKKQCSVTNCTEDGEYTPIITVPDPRFTTKPEVAEFFLHTVSVCDKHRRELTISACIRSRVLWDYILQQCGQRGFQPEFETLRLEYITEAGVRVIR